MSRFLLLLIIGALAAMAIVYGLRTAQKTSSAAVTSLLPPETVAFAHLPDFNRTREQWHQSDIYQLYREPAIQDFLGKPLRRVPKAGSFSQTVRDLEQLDLKDGFVALTSMANDNAKIVAGFRFHGSQEDAEKVIGRWRSQLLANGPTTNHETLDYQQHKIDIATIGSKALATVYDGNWFLASNDANELQATLDRVDGRSKDQKAALNADESFREAMAQMPASYSLLLYLQPKTFADRLSALRAASVGRPATSGQGTLFEQIRSVCATTRFENGKMHDVVFVGIPKQEEDADLARSSLALGTRETFLYVASLINFSKQLALFDPSVGGNFLGAGLQKIGTTLAAAKITPEDWKAAFGAELALLANWPESNHWPSLILTSPVKDGARARKIVDVFTHALDEDGVWKQTERDGAHYWSLQTTPYLFAIRPTVAVSNRVMVTGLDDASVEAAMRGSENPTSKLANSDTYKSVARSVPAPTNFFAYVDTGLFYTRLDDTLRPMLLMSAAFMPWMNEYVDVSKLPPPEIVAKHLSPIVSSQRYHGNGYIAESVGPITLNQSGIAVGLLGGIGALGYKHGIGGGLSPWSLLAPPASTPAPSGTP